MKLREARETVVVVDVVLTTGGVVTISCKYQLTKIFK